MEFLEQPVGVMPLGIQKQPPDPDPWKFTNRAEASAKIVALYQQDKNAATSGAQSV